MHRIELDGDDIKWNCYGAFWELGGAFNYDGVQYTVISYAKATYGPDDAEWIYRARRTVVVEEVRDGLRGRYDFKQYPEDLPGDL